jgi:hypothetical protein
VRRQHVVIGGDDAEIGDLVAGERRLLVRGAGGETVGEIAAGSVERFTVWLAAPAMRSR